MTKVDELTKLATLYEKGLLSEPEFIEQKKRIIGDGNESPSNASEDSSQVSLWNPEAAASWSFLMSPAFGMILHAMNWKRLGRPGWVIVSIAWAVVYVAATLLIALSTGSSNENEHHGQSLILHYGALVIWYMLFGRRQTKLIRKRFGKTYQRRSWRKPLIIGLLCLVLQILLLGAILASQQGVFAAISEGCSNADAIKLLRQIAVNELEGDIEMATGDRQKWIGENAPQEDQVLFDNVRTVSSDDNAHRFTCIADAHFMGVASTMEVEYAAHFSADGYVNVSVTDTRSIERYVIHGIASGVLSGALRKK